jgi:hypothetical protein
MDQAVAFEFPKVKRQHPLCCCRQVLSKLAKPPGSVEQAEQNG